MRAWAFLLSAVVLAACGGDDGPQAIIQPRDGPQAIIQTEGGEVAVAVEIADSDAELEKGLMHRASLGEDAGMIFLFPGEHRGPFWMKDTLIPLSIAFVGGDGRIRRILDMEPCRADPCRLYEPGVSYTRALEVNRGAFARWGVAEGDSLRLER